MMNRVQILGRLGKDPELRKTQTGDSIASFNLAVSEKWTDKQGEKQEHTEWIPVVVFGKAADTAAQYLRKGNRVLVEGQFKTRNWEKDGVKRYTTEVVVRGFGGLTIIDWADSANTATHNTHAAQTHEQDDFGDEMPF